jgi:hypothetical protein
MSDAKVAYGFDGRGKVRQRCRFGQNLPQTSLSVFNPKILPLPAIRLKGIWQRKQATDGKNRRIERNGLQTKLDIGVSSVSRSFFFLSKGHCSAIIGQTTNCTPSRKIKLYSVDRQSGSRHSASFRYRIHGRVFYRPTGCRQYAPRCGSPEVSGNSLSSLPTLPCW